MNWERTYEPELLAETIDAVIQEAEAKEREVEHLCYHKSTYSNPFSRSLLHLLEAREFLRRGYTVSWCEHGILVDNRFVVASVSRKWRAKYKSKWYRYSAKSLLRILEGDAEKN